VQNGAHVAAGDILVELDPAEATADERATLNAHAAWRAERLRRRAALEAVETGAPLPAPRWPDDIPAPIREREERVLKGNLRQLRIGLQSIDAQIAQKRDEEGRLDETIRAEEALIETLKSRVEMRKALFARNSTPRAAVIDAMESLQMQLTALATQKGQLNEARAAQAVLEKDRQKAIDPFIADNSQKLAEAERQVDDLEQRAAKARVKTAHMTLRSPIDGVVHGLSVTTKGQVVTTSEELMRIVPDGAPLEIEAYLENRDIGFVRPGQAAIVKIESFPFTRYGALDATVLRVAHDAIPEPDAQSAEGNPARSQKGAGYFSGGQRVQNLVFPVTLQSKPSVIDVDGFETPLTPGMAVSVEIKTGRRRLLEYLFSPLVETASRALRER